MTATNETTTGHLLAVLAGLADVMAGIGPGQRHGPTPCTEYDVGQLRDHVVGWLATFAAGFADPGGRAPRADLDGYTPPADPAAGVREAATTLGDALRAGAAGRPLRLGESAMPGGMALRMILWEYLVHGWDLARATGQRWAPPAGAAEESLNFAPAMLTGDYQGEGKAFGPRVTVPEDAPPMDRLLGLSGRDPRWRPAGPAAPLIARFQVDSAQPEQVAGLDGDWARLMILRKTFTSGIIGRSITLFMPAGPEEGSRSYVATERISGRTEDGREGSIVVQHGSSETDPAAWSGHIVPKTGTGDFADWCGSARIVHDHQGAYFEITFA